MDLGAPPAYEVQVPPQFHGGRVIPYVATWPLNMANVAGSGRRREADAIPSARRAEAG